MATAQENSYQVSLEMLQTAAKNPLFSTFSSPPSETTEIMDTDFESDYNDEFDNSPRRSAGSLVADSVTTASTPREIPTPDSAGALSAFHFHFDDETTMGPSGPHLFRSSVSSDEYKSTYEVDFFLAKTPTTAVFSKQHTSALRPQRRKDTPLPEHTAESPAQTQLQSINAAVSALDEAEVRSWSPPDVVRWMQNAGFDDGIVEKFFINDISGAILLELQVEDLKELDIQSFGKRRHLMNSIQHLRDSVMVSSADMQTPLACTPQSRGSTSPDSSSSSECAFANNDKDSKKGSHKKHRRHRHRRTPKETIPTIKDFNPEDLASIVAIEQFLPRPHRCSKGEDCRKWQKQQRKIARLAKDLPIDINAASQLLSDQNQYNPPQTSKSLPGTEPMLTPSIVASSDVLGPEQPAHFHLSEEKLNEVCQRDPQESVRQFLTFQHLSPIQTDNGVSPVQTGLYQPLDVDSPDSTRTTASLAENLRTLPKLTIPVSHDYIVSGSLSASLSAQRTVTPSILRRKPNFSSVSIDGTLHAANQQPFSYGQYTSPVDYHGSPSDFYRSDERYHQSTPLSEVDVPITAIPAVPIERIISQSVPPNMRFGYKLSAAMAEPIRRPTSTKAENHRRDPFYNGPTIQILDRVDESMGPIDTIEDFTATPKATPRSPTDIVQRGYMKKRKTTRLLRHEWENHHFTLKGTRLAMYDDEDSSRRDSKALEYIDVDDYAVACSSLASSSKLTAAFKKTVLKRRDNAQGEGAFAFSLIPTPNGSQSSSEWKGFFNNSVKPHHFAVTSRDERIDWMRELMLAKALKKGKESGDSVHLNGQMF
ncbi:hypothetical protein BGW36DRAFT_337715 [Talaromyces proteolyticus]|uniref:SAM and PH domain protein n=1 Tax=Talaromyces proteolyticus TaxID=1131652 RepID=A0AAD4KZT3_9EURO|nr:uncharacterized protein BGW36DRAFT_337715 [Talaromyces proteolyticus]KAH8700289.1 hypothetical protein BGW36DRAFT_337715 [Talaromyces proteolyticus]